MNQNTQDAIASAATKAADLWTSYLDRPWDNGVPATNLLVASLQKQTASPEQKTLFHRLLIEHFKKQLNEGNLCVYLGTDYSPDPKLEVLIKRMGLKPRPSRATLCCMC